MLITRNQRLMISGICIIIAISLFLWTYPQIPLLGGRIDIFSLHALGLFVAMASTLILFILGLAGLLIKRTSPSLDQRVFEASIGEGDVGTEKEFRDQRMRFPRRLDSDDFIKRWGRH